MSVTIKIRDVHSKSKLNNYQISEIINELQLSGMISDRLRDQLSRVWLYPSKYQEFKREIIRHYYRALVPGGEQVGILAATSIGEPTTQLMLNTFHYSGVSNRRITSGVPRFKEVIDLNHPKCPFCTIVLKDGAASNIESLRKFFKDLVWMNVSNFTRSCKVIEPRKTIDSWYPLLCRLYGRSSSTYKNRWFLRLTLNRAKLHAFRIGMHVLLDRIKKASEEFDVIVSPQSEGIIDIYVDPTAYETVKGLMVTKKERTSDDRTDKAITSDTLIDEAITSILTDDDFFRSVVKTIVYSVNICGINGIKDVMPRQQDDKWVIETVGSAFGDILNLDFVDFSKCFSNDLRQVYHTLGIEAVRQAIILELKEALKGGSNIDPRHIQILVDMMTTTGNITPINRFGMGKDVSPISKASFEEAMKTLLNAGINNISDELKGVSSKIVMGQMIRGGTGYVDLFVDDKMLKEYVYEGDEDDEDDEDDEEESEVMYNDWNEDLMDVLKK
jgi:DNA-directed RNA polymerase II subunit RPB1